MKRCIAALLALVLLVGLLPVMSAQAETKYATVVGGWLRLREGSSFNARTITSYYTGTQIKILGTYGSWYQVQTPDGRTGYMYSDFLSINGNTANTNATVVSGNGYGVRLRRGPSTSYGVIGKYPVGTRARILESGKYWCRISINGTTGYMMSEFLSRDGSSSPTYYVCDANVWSGNGYGVRLRTGPGKNFSKIGTYSVGTPVKVIQKGAIWDYIQIGSRVGYMMNEFLTYNTHTSVSGVTINNMSPVIGNILSVHTVTPASATVTYEWMRKDSGGNVTIVGTNAAYSITSADAGCALQLHVVGVGNYTGSAVSGYTSVVKENRTLNGLTLDNMNPVVGDKLTPKPDPTDATFTCAWEVNGKTSTSDTYTVSSADMGHTVKLTITGTGEFEGSSKSVETAAVAAKGTVENVLIVNETTPSATAPNVGDKLSAQVVPSTATVDYEWTVLNGSTVVKTLTGESIEVDSSYKDCTIQLKAKANGSYDGEATATTGVVTDHTQLTGVTINGDAQPVVKNGTGSKLDAAVEPSGATAEFHWYAGDTEVATGSSYTVTATDGGKAITVKAIGNGDYCGTVTSTPTAAVAVAHSTFDAKASGTNIVGYEFAVEFTGDGTEPSTWTLGGSIPGMTISGNQISGQPTAADSYTINVKVSNAAGEVAFGDYTITVLPEQQKPVVTIPSENQFIVGQDIGSVKFTATEAPITSWSVEGTMCPGLSLDTTTGTLSGTPSAAGSYTINVKATNKAGTSDPASYNFSVLDDITLSGYNTSYTFESGSEVDFTVSATGGSGSYTWSVTPSDQFQIVDGKVTAIDPDLAENSYTVTVTATDSSLSKTTEAITVTIDKPDSPPVPVSITCPTDTTFAYDETIEAAFSATGGSGSYLWTLSSDVEAHEALFAIDATGALTATGTVAAGVYILTITATDASDPTNTSTTEPITIRVEAEP